MTSELYDINQPKELILKAESHRACPVCDEPVNDAKFATFDLGGGLEVKLHTGCMQQVLDAVEPVAEKIPVNTSKSVRKSTVPTGYAYDKDSLKERIRYEFSLLLLKHGFLTQ